MKILSILLLAPSLSWAHMEQSSPGVYILPSDIQQLVIQAPSGSAIPILIVKSSGGVTSQQVDSDGDTWIKTMKISNDIDAMENPYSMTVSTDGTPQLNASATQYIIGDLFVEGQIISNSSKVKAIFVPKGGIHLSEEEPDSNTPPGQMFSKRVKTSTLTFKGSAMLWEDDNGVVVSTMSATELTISQINVTEVSAGKLKNQNSGSGAPADEDCDAADEKGLQYVSDSPQRLYLCVDDGFGGYEWRHTNLTK